jgi:hypothetical protein
MKLRTPEEFINGCMIANTVGPAGIVTAHQLRLRDAEVMGKAAELVMRLLPQRKRTSSRPALELRRAAISLSLTAKLIRSGEYNL